LRETTGQKIFGQFGRFIQSVKRFFSSKLRCHNKCVGEKTLEVGKVTFNQDTWIPTLGVLEQAEKTRLKGIKSFNDELSLEDDHLKYEVIDTLFRCDKNNFN
jgi:hypothetical protein